MLEDTTLRTADNAEQSAGGGGLRQVERLRDLSPDQWRCGIAAWLGWLFDGLELHLYTLVGLPFVAELLARPVKDDQVTYCGSLIQASFLLGWALGGGLFGHLGDRLGRSRALVLTILTYALFTGLSAIAMQWWHLLVFRFLAALGIGGEWAVGAAMLSETWPRQWRAWIAAVLQTGVNLGIILGMIAGIVLASQPYRVVFLVGILPALLVFWIRRNVPEPEEWHAASERAASEPKGTATGGIRGLFRAGIRKTTILTMLVCGFSLSGHWAFIFWYLQHFRNLPEFAESLPEERTRWTSLAMILVIGCSSLGNFIAAWVARRIGYRRTIALGCVLYTLMVLGAYAVPLESRSLLVWFVPIGMCQGLFALFTMYLPPLFPTLLRTTGAGFCFNIGRVAAAAATVCFGRFSNLGDYRLAMILASLMFLPAAALSMLLPEE